MFKTIRQLVSFFLIITILGVSVLIKDCVYGISPQVFTSQDSVVPGLNLNLISGTDTPSTLSAVTGGQKLWSSYDKDTSVSHYTAHVRADVFLNYGDNPSEVVGVFNDTVQMYFNPTYWQGVQSDPTNIFLRYEVLANSYTYVYHGNTASFLNYYYCAAEKIVYDPNHPNFSYEIDIHGTFGSDAEVLSLLDLLSNHCVTIIASKQLTTPANAPAITVTFADGTANGQAGDTVTVKGSNWTPNTPVTLIGAFNPYTRTVPSNQVNSEGAWSTTAITSNAIEPGNYTITAKQGSLSATCQMTILAGATNVNLSPCLTIITSVIGQSAYVKQGDIGSWMPAQVGNAIAVDGEIRVTEYAPGVTQLVEAKVYPPNTQVPIPSSEAPLITMTLRSGTVKLLKDELAAGTKAQCAFDITPDASNNASTYVHFFTTHKPGIDSDNLVYSNQALFHDLNTDFELIGNASQTTVYTFQGTVEASDTQNTTTVEVSANHAATVTASGTVLQPTSFDPSSIDQWWTTTPTATNTPARTPLTTESTDSALTILNMLPLLAVVALAILVAVVTGVVWRKKRKRTQTDYLPPPPPPPSQQN